VQVVFGAYLRYMYIDSHKTKSRLAPVPRWTFCLIQCRTKIRTFGDNGATVFER